MLTIWGRTNSINVQKVLWCCGELGLPYKRIDAGLSFGVNNTPDYLAQNPNGLVPTIDDDGYVLWESNSIVRYLASRHATGTLCPADPQTRFLAERWMDWQLTASVPLGILYRGLIRTPPEKRDHGVIASAKSDSEAAMKILDAHLASRDFVEAGRLTMGDIPIGVIAYRWFGLGNPRETLPNLARYYDRLTERPAYRDGVMVPLT
jgi:glutathione S-transferase